MMAVHHGLTTRRSLLEALRDGSNDAAWREFLTLYQPLIVSWCLRSGLRIDDAEEVCAEIISKLVVVMQGFVLDPKYRFRGWLKTVVKHSIIDFLRKRRHEGRVVPLDHPQAQSSLRNCAAQPELDQIAGALEEAVNEGLEIMERIRRQVSSRTWQAFWLTAVLNEPTRLVADKLNMSLAAVYTSKSRVARLLRDEGARG